MVRWSGRSNPDVVVDNVQDIGLARRRGRTDEDRDKYHGHPQHRCRNVAGRPHLTLHLPLRKRKIGDFDTELVKEFFQALVNHAAITLHAEVRYGANAHHMVESLFKAFGRALRQAATRDQKVRGIPSTKGSL